MRGKIAKDLRRIAVGLKQQHPQRKLNADTLYKRLKRDYERGLFERIVKKGGKVVFKYKPQNSVSLGKKVEAKPTGLRPGYGILRT